MTASSTVDLCVIGAGSGGLAVAMGAAALGVPVVLIEKGDMGGQSFKSTVPSMALIAAGRAAHAMRTAERFGVAAREPRIDYPRIRTHLRDVSVAVSPNASVARLEAMNVKVIRAPACFTSKDTVEAGGATIRARRFVVATGSSPARIQLAGLEQIRCFAPESIREIEALPSRLVIIGATAEGVELAQAFHRLGCEVTILEAGKALAGEDPELADILLVQLAGEGIGLRENVGIVRVEPRGAHVRVVLAGKAGPEMLEASHLLLAAGRTPNVEGLGLEAAGITYSQSGIVLDRNLRSSNRRVYAVGGVAGAPFAGAASYQASLVLRASLMGLPARIEPALIPRVIFTDPEFAMAGLPEEEARRRHGAIRVLRWPFAENERALAERATTGHIKVILSKRGIVLGVGIVGPHAGELIGPWQFAISKALKVDDMAGLATPFPTLSEVSQRAAVTGVVGRWRSPLASRLMHLIRAFG